MTEKVLPSLLNFDVAYNHHERFDSCIAKVLIVHSDCGFQSTIDVMKPLQARSLLISLCMSLLLSLVFPLPEICLPLYFFVPFACVCVCVVFCNQVIIE